MASNVLFTKGERVGVSLATLWDTLKDSAHGRRTRCCDLLVHTEDDSGSDWFDLYADGSDRNFDGPVCCDGETCVVERVCPVGTVHLRNAESDKVFGLSATEAATACFAA